MNVLCQWVDLPLRILRRGILLSVFLVPGVMAEVQHRKQFGRSVRDLGLMSNRGELGVVEPSSVRATSMPLAHMDSAES